MSIKLAENLYLYSKKIDSVEKSARQKINHIWIYDRSASMTGLLPSLINDLRSYIESDTAVKNGDVLTLAWFSTEGDYDVVLKGMVVTPETRSGIIATIMDNSRPRNLTCFSEVLNEVTKIVKDTRFFSDTFSLMFFTDGYPVVSNYEKEISSIFNAIEDIVGKLNYTTVIGYGQYYNRNLLSRMARSFGGNLAHADTIRMYQDRLDEYLVGSGSTAKRVQVDIGVAPEAAFYLDNDDTSIVHIYNQDNILFVPEDVHRIYYILPVDIEGQELSETENQFIPAFYASAVVMNRLMQTDKAIEILSNKLGDVYAIDLLNDAWSNSDYGYAEDEICKMMADPHKMFQKGVVRGYATPTTRFCLLDLLDMLQENNAKFYPYAEEFEYQRIGVKRVVREGYPKFVPNDASPACSLVDMVWHDSRLNLSVKVKIDGTVYIGEEAYQHKIFPYYPTHIWRTYNLVNNGALNVYHMPVSCDYSIYSKLRDLGVDVGNGFTWLPNDDPYHRICYFVIDLRSIPIINKSIQHKQITAVEFCKMKLAEYKNEAKLKVVRYYKDIIEEKIKSQSDKEVEEFLETKGIKPYGYAPPTDAEPATDYYMTNEFTVTAKGLSSFPKVTDVLERIESGKKQTTAGEMMAQFASAMSDVDKRGDSALFERVINDYYHIVKKDLAKVRSELQKAKFTILLAKKWFPDLNARDGATLDVDGYTFTFGIREVKENY